MPAGVPTPLRYLFATFRTHPPPLPPPPLPLTLPLRLPPSAYQQAGTPIWVRWRTTRKYLNKANGCRHIRIWHLRGRGDDISVGGTQRTHMAPLAQPTEAQRTHMGSLAQPTSTAVAP